MKPIFINRYREKLKELCIQLEHYETDQWAVDAILDELNLNGNIVLDPCVGTGVLARSAKLRGNKVTSIDIYDWGYKGTQIIDFLHPNKKQIEILKKAISGGVVLMNPPFKYATHFVEQALKLGAGLVICFQRHAWLESDTRKVFWSKYKPEFIYLCGNRATCWRHDIPKKKRKTGSSTAHSWFIFSTFPVEDTRHRILYRKKHPVRTLSKPCQKVVN